MVKSPRIRMIQNICVLGRRENKFVMNPENISVFFDERLNDDFELDIRISDHSGEDGFAVMTGIGMSDLPWGGTPICPPFQKDPGSD